MTFEELLNRVNQNIGLKIYIPYVWKQHRIYELSILFSYQIWVRNFRQGYDFYWHMSNPLHEYKWDVRQPSQQEIWSREKKFGLSKDEIKRNLFALNNGKEGWYLVNLEAKTYLYFENRDKLYEYVLENKLGRLVPVAMAQQN